MILKSASQGTSLSADALVLSIRMALCLLRLYPGRVDIV